MSRSKMSSLVLSVLMAACLSTSAFANSGELLNFHGLGDLSPVGNFYNGGGLADTPNYGVSFSSNFFGLRSFANGGSGNFSGTLTGVPAIFINGTLGSAVTGTMNVAPGFSTGLNFYYTAGFASNQFLTLKVWSGSNGTGTVLATIVLANNNGSCTAPAYCMWSDAGVTFSGTAHSVTFTGPANEFGLSNLTLGSSQTAVPEPSTILLLNTGAVGVFACWRRRLFRS